MLTVKRLILFGIGFMFFISCSKEERVHVSVLPMVIDAELHFRGFVTDEEEELVSKIHHFSKKVTRQDTIGGRPVFVCLSNDQETYFYTDEDGTVWESNTIDVGARIVKYGFSYVDTLLVRRWDILLKVNAGVGTEWSVSIDTVFDAKTLQGKAQRIRYIYQGKARYEGRTATYIPENHEMMDVFDAHWYDLGTHIINESTGDTLFSTSGIAHQYFEADLGAVKYITNFTKTERGEPTLALRGSWELMRKEIPE